MASNEFGQNFVRGPAKRPEWAQMIRLGGDRVAVLLAELRKSVGKVDGISERLRYSRREACWEVRYDVEARELFTIWVSPGLLEAGIPLARSEFESLLKTRVLSGTFRDALGSYPNGVESNRLNLELVNHRMMRSFIKLATAKAKLAQRLGK